MSVKFQIKKLSLKSLSKLGLVDTFLVKKPYSKNLKKRLAFRGISPLPKRAKWELTMLCNLNCKMCHQKERRKDIYKELKIEEIKKIIDNLARNDVKKLLLKGGELFVRPDIFEILNYIQKKNFRINIITNGVLLNEERSKKLLKYNNIDVLTFSIDGLRETHNKIRNTKIGFDRTINAIRILANKNFLINMATVIQEDNIDEIKGLINLGKKLRVNTMSFTMEMFYSKEQVELSERASNQKISMYIKKGNYPYSYEKIKKIQNFIKKESRRSGIYINLYPPITKKHLKKFYINRVKDLDLICDTFFEANIDENGNILACPTIKKNFGNLLNEDLKEIWNKKEFRDFRKDIIKKNLLPVCTRCCKLDAF